MRNTFIFLIALALLTSCTRTETTKVSSDTTIANMQGRKTTIKTERQLLIEELKRLQRIIAAKDKEKIADILQFPLADTTVGIYIEDSAFNAQYKTNDNVATRAMFISHFTEISESLQMDQITRLFKEIDIERLLQKDALKKEKIIRNEPCYSSYEVTVENDDSVTLILATNSNKNFKNKSLSEDEIPENSSEYCEYTAWWVFKFDGMKLHLKKISVAG